MRVDCLWPFWPKVPSPGFSPAFEGALRLEGSAARNGARVVNPDQKDQVRVGYVGLVMESRLRRCTGRHDVVVAPPAVSAEHQRSRKRLIQESGIALRRRSQLNEIDFATDRARTRQRILAHKVLLEGQVCR